MRSEAIGNAIIRLWQTGRSQTEIQKIFAVHSIDIGRDEISSLIRLYICAFNENRRDRQTIGQEHEP
mgnify:CR=1 FL=1